MRLEGQSCVILEGLFSESWVPWSGDKHTHICLYVNHQTTPLSASSKTRQGYFRWRKLLCKIWHCAWCSPCFSEWFSTSLLLFWRHKMLPLNSVLFRCLVLTLQENVSCKYLSSVFHPFLASVIYILQNTECHLFKCECTDDFWLLKFLTLRMQAYISFSLTHTVCECVFHVHLPPYWISSG